MPPKYKNTIWTADPATAPPEQANGEGSKPKTFEEKEREGDPPAAVEEHDYWAFVPWGARSFEDVLAARAMDEAMRKVNMYSNMLPELVRNITMDRDTDISAKRSELGRVVNEYLDLVENELSAARQTSLDMENEPSLDPPSIEELELKENQIPVAETYRTKVDVFEGDPDADVFTLEVQAIEPGWGNKRDNNFYPATMLEAYASKLIGAKMFEDEHRTEKRTNKVWVSTVTDLIGFTEHGAPRLKVVVHDPGFEERARRLHKAKLLDKLECSLLASGRGEKGFEQDGRKGTKVTEIEEVFSLDWVSRAGAGGKALSIIEDDGGNTMDKKDQPAGQETQADDTQPVEEKDVEPVVIHEGEETPETPKEAPAEDTPDETTETVEEADPVDLLLLETSVIDRVVRASKLPADSQTKLKEDEYLDLEALQTAVREERARLAEAAKARAPKDVGESKPNPPVNVEEAKKKASKELDAVVTKHLGNGRTSA